MQRFLCFTLLFTLMLALTSGGSFAAQSSPAEKFVRGVSNSAFGWVSYWPQVNDHGPVGIAYGTAETVRRTVVGSVELGTFLFPNPRENGNWNYKPMIRPVHPWQGSSLSARSRASSEQNTQAPIMSWNGG